MIANGAARFGRFHRLFSRNAWAARLLAPPRAAEEQGARGLVLIQIDGLSRKQFEAATARGRMPFLQRLLTREDYRLATLYSGVPSSTPSVQGELFYGVRCATPAFSYFSEAMGREVAMTESAAAEQVERTISAGRNGLLSGGAAYCDVYTGGAVESHFCATNLGLGGFLRSFSTWRLLVVSTWCAWSLLRAAGLTFLELALAIGGVLTGALHRGEFFEELRFIPARMAIVVLLRELVTIGATLDVARGVRIVHLNLLGYDEHAHRRGPESAFAHWALKGVDRSVRAIWRAAHRTASRDYDVWVYSDHGQETTTPYEQACGQTIDAAVAAAARRLSGVRVARHPHNTDEAATDKQTPRPRVVANGPIGLVYFPERPRPETLLQFACRMVNEEGCPLVLLVTGDGAVAAVDQNGRHALPADAVAVLGADHPFREAIADDLVRLATHPDAGDAVLCGWNRRGDSLSFPRQHGAHAGPGIEETSAFLLAPIDAPLTADHKNYYRPDDLRRGVLRFLDERASARPAGTRRDARERCTAASNDLQRSRPCGHG